MGVESANLPPAVPSFSDPFVSLPVFSLLELFGAVAPISRSCKDRTFPMDPEGGLTARPAWLPQAVRQLSWATARARTAYTPEPSRTASR